MTGRKKVRSRSIPVAPGSRNVFVDLDFKDAGARTTKVAFAVNINGILKANGLTRTTAARVLGVNQPKIAALINYRLDGFSIARLMNFLTALGRATSKLQSVPGARRALRGGS